MSQKKKIIQLLPARPGWEAIYWHRQGEDKNFGGKAYHTIPLECWALVEDEDGDTEIAGTVLDDWECGPRAIDNIGEFTFIAYHHTDDLADCQEEALQARNAH